MKNYMKPSVEEIRLTSMEAITSGGQQPGIESGNGSDADF